jgi:hypothetical protein
MNTTMKLTKSSKWIIITTIAAILLAACSQTPAPQTKIESTATPSVLTLSTTMGDFVIVSTRLVDSVHDTQAPPGSKFLLIGLTKPDLKKLVLGEFSLEDFQKMINADHKNIFITGSDGSQSAYTQMGGWIEDDFVIGFTVPIVETYTLYWTGNPPILLVPSSK